MEHVEGDARLQHDREPPPYENIEKEVRSRETETSGSIHDEAKSSVSHLKAIANPPEYSSQLQHGQEREKEFLRDLLFRNALEMEARRPQNVLCYSCGMFHKRDEVLCYSDMFQSSSCRNCPAAKSRLAIARNLEVRWWGVSHDEITSFGPEG